MIKHTNVVSVYIPASISGDTNWPTVPSEFLQAEQRIAELNSHPPVPGEHGYWLIWNVTLSRYEESQFSLPAGGSSDSGGTPNAVQYVEQTLTTDQQKQARKNIGAMSADTEIPIVPEALPNPNALTFSGAISATYDGKNAVTVKIPQGGSGDNFGELIASATLKETAATVEITGLNLGVGSYTIIIRGAGGGTAASGLTVELNGISKGGYTGGYGSSASELSLAVLSVLDSRIIGASMMANGGKNEYLWDSFALPITSVSVYSPYHLTDETKYFSAGTVVEIYRGIMLHNL